MSGVSSVVGLSISVAWRAGRVAKQLLFFALASMATSALAQGVPWPNLAITFAGFSSVKWERLAAEPALAAAVPRARTAIRFLEDKWMSDSKRSDVPHGYVDSLRADSDVLRAASEKQQLNASDVALVQDAIVDLEIKEAHCKAPNIEWAELVQQTVSTLKSGKPASGYEVWYAPRGWAGNANYWQRFSKLSTPTSQALAPGVYMIRAKAGKEVPMRVGGTGEKTGKFDLAVD